MRQARGIVKVYKRLRVIVCEWFECSRVSQDRPSRLSISVSGDYTASRLSPHVNTDFQCFPVNSRSYGIGGMLLILSMTRINIMKL